MKKILNYRIDRITDVELIGEARSGEEEFKVLDMESYLNEHLSMYNGKEEHVTLRAVNTLLDTFVDRFGTRNVIYTTDDERHFTARVSVSVSEQFYGWLCGLGSKVKILSPDNVREDFRAYIFKIQRLYD